MIRISKNAFKDSTKLCHLHKTLQPHRNFGLHIPDPCDGSDHCTPCPGHTLAHISFRNGIDVFYLLASIHIKNLQPSSYYIPKLNPMRGGLSIKEIINFRGKEEEPFLLVFVVKQERCGGERCYKDQMEPEDCS